MSATTQVSRRSGETGLERVTQGAKRFVTVSTADRALWESVVARRVYDLDSGELLAAELLAAQNAIAEITGEFTNEDLLGEIFSSFCIGK